MKVKKEIRVPASDIVVGDVVVFYGTVVFVRACQDLNEIQFAYLDNDSGYLEAEELSQEDRLDVIREVGTPDSVTVESLYGNKILIKDDEESVAVEITVFDKEGRPATYGLLVDANELIDAIKTVKGLD